VCFCILYNENVNIAGLNQLSYSVSAGRPVGQVMALDHLANRLLDLAALACCPIGLAVAPDQFWWAAVSSRQPTITQLIFENSNTRLLYRNPS
jgi:hypothetical protein